MVSKSSGRPVANQFIITDKINGNNYTRYFQSYKSIIAKEVVINGNSFITLDEYYWDYSTTTGKYRNMFLGESKKETETKIKSGIYQLTNLN